VRLLSFRDVQMLSTFITLRRCVDGIVYRLRQTKSKDGGTLVH
jgi:hypothetical protein